MGLIHQQLLLISLIIYIDLIIFIISFISSLKTINVVILDPHIFFWIAASVPYAAPGYSNGIKTLLANGLSMSFIKDKSIFNNGSRSLPKNPPDCLTLNN